MKKTLMFSLIFAVLISVMPFIGTVSAESQKLSGEELNQITAEILNTLRDEPTGGRVITRSELNAILAQYSKGFASGNVLYMKTVNGDFEKKNNKWELGKKVERQETWIQNTGNEFASMRTEILTLSGKDKPVGTIDVTLIKNDDNFTYMYTWVKWEKEGKLIKIPKQYYKSNPDLIPGRKAAGEKVPDGKAILFDDQTVNEQLCRVYSLTGVNPKLGASQDNYHWFSTERGFEIINAAYQRDVNKIMQNTTITFEHTSIEPNASLFEPPSDVKFREDGPFGAGSSGDSTNPEANKKPRNKFNPFGF